VRAAVFFTGDAMFADPVSNLMLVILIFFSGLLIMFFFIMRSLERNDQNILEAHKQLAIGLTDLERRVAQLAFFLKKNEMGKIDEDSRKELTRAFPEKMEFELSPGSELERNR
jgi:hypothetical protein